MFKWLKDKGQESLKNQFKFKSFWAKDFNEKPIFDLVD